METAGKSGTASAETPRTSSNTSMDSLANFASLLGSIAPESLVSLAMRVRRGRSIEDKRRNEHGCTVLQPPRCGSFNLLYTLQFADGVQWVVRIPAPGEHGHYTPSALRDIRSEAMTMSFLRQNTSIPIPEIYDFDGTTNNELGVPYILMELAKGFPVSEKWFDVTGPTSLEARRLRILDTVAAAMVQLSRFKFEKIGSLQFASAQSIPTTLAECMLIDEEADLDAMCDNANQGVHIRKLGPFDTSQGYFLALANLHTPSQDTFAVGMHQLLTMMIRCLPPSILNHGPESFVLAHPDFDSQNVLVSEDGTVTAFIDWDNVHTTPRCIGYHRYPAWITRDWDPLKYGYQKPDSRPENSPEELQSYRQRYAETMKTLLPYEKDFTTNSHLWEAVWIAASSSISADHIVEKIFLHLFPDDIETDPLYLYETAVDLAENSLSEEVRSRIMDAIHVLLSIHE